VACTRRAHSSASASTGSVAARRAATPRSARTSYEPGSPAGPEAETGSASSYERPSTILAWGSIRRSTRCGSHKWEPTCSAALRRTTTQSESPRSSGAPSSTQSDGDRHPERLRNSLTRKRSLIQIQCCPRFPKPGPWREPKQELDPRGRSPQAAEFAHSITRHGTVSPRRKSPVRGVVPTTTPNQRPRIFQPSMQASTPVSPSRQSHRSS
jgi:hypothetical protein